MAIESIEEVRLFRQVVASGSISAAARALGDQKNRISQRIASLERSLGVRLADRTTRTLKLTDEGERFLAASDSLIEAVERVESAVTRGDAIEGRVRVALRSANIGIGIGEEVARMMSASPGLQLQIVVLDEDAEPLSLQAQGIDLAVQVGRLRDSNLVAKRVGNVPFAMCATPAYLRSKGRPRKPGDLLHHECIRRLGDVRETTWALVDRHGRSRPTPIGGRLECSDARFQYEILYAGFGIGLRPASEVRRAVQEGTLERVLPSFSFEPVPVWVVGPKSRLRLPRVVRVVELVARVIAALA